MKKILLIGLLFIFGCCKPKPEFYINGKGYYTKTYCLKSHTEYVFDYHYGYNIMNGKFQFYLGPHNKTICDEYKNDTILIK